jgi:hypothetical protein
MASIHRKKCEKSNIFNASSGWRGTKSGTDGYFLVKPVRLMGRNEGVTNWGTKQPASILPATAPDSALRAPCAASLQLL